MCYTINLSNTLSLTALNNIFLSLNFKERLFLEEVSLENQKLLDRFHIDTEKLKNLSYNEHRRKTIDLFSQIKSSPLLTHLIQDKYLEIAILAYLASFHISSPEDYITIEDFYQLELETERMKIRSFKQIDLDHFNGIFIRKISMGGFFSVLTDYLKEEGIEPDNTEPSNLCSRGRWKN